SRGLSPSCTRLLDECIHALHDNFMIDNPALPDIFKASFDFLHALLLIIQIPTHRLIQHIAAVPVHGFSQSIKFIHFF
ncbi:MAG: hypothetical protein ABSG47_13885, partial [Terracidiphilus sp.]